MPQFNFLTHFTIHSFNFFNSMSKDYETTGVLSSGEMDPFRQAIPVLSSTLDLLFESDYMRTDYMKDGSLRGDTDYTQKSVLNSQNGQNGQNDGDYCVEGDEKSKWSTEETATLSSAACRLVFVFSPTLILISLMF